MRTKLAFILAGGVVKRFHTLPTLHTQNIAEHSFGVAWVCWLLTEGTPSAALLMAALTHDLAEHTTGDLPAPAKRAMGVGMQFHLAEATALAAANIHALTLTPAEQRTLKLADIAELLLFCVREAALGNRKLRPAYHRGLAYVLEMEPLSATERNLFVIIGELYNDRE